MSETFLQLIKRVAKDCGHDLSDDQAGYILWNHTGFPNFFDGDPEECCTKQIQDFFRVADIDTKRRDAAYSKWIDDGHLDTALERDRTGEEACEPQVWHAACAVESSYLNGLYEPAMGAAREIFEIAYQEECMFGNDCFTEKRGDDGHAPNCPLRLLGMALKNLPQSPGAGGTRPSLRISVSELHESGREIAALYNRYETLSRKMSSHFSVFVLEHMEEADNNKEIRRLSEELEQARGSARSLRQEAGWEKSWTFPWEPKTNA
jgi:hypothetical protein